MDPECAIKFVARCILRDNEIDYQYTLLKNIHLLGFLGLFGVPDCLGFPGVSNINNRKRSYF